MLFSVLGVWLFSSTSPAASARIIAVAAAFVDGLCRPPAREAQDHGHVDAVWPIANNLFQPFQLGDQSLDHAEPALPERGVVGIKTEWRQQLGMVFGAAGGEHVEIALGKTFGCPLVDGVKRVHQ